MTLLLQLILILLPSPALLTHGGALLSVSQRITRDTKGQPIKLMVSEPCLQGSESCDPSEAKGKEVELEPGSPLVLTHRIRLVQGSGAGCGGCEADFAALRERIERLEREVSELREKCGGSEGGCCTSQQSQGAGCTTVRPPTDECPDDCSDQGRCVDGKCECFPGFSGPDCSQSNCPGNCNDKGKCVNGQCVCDPGFTGPDCSQGACPSNCNNRGRCVNGQCVCDPGFTGPDCSAKACPKNCSNRGRCVNGKCVCDAGFAGPDCSARACPGNCNKRGRCVNGKCVCESGFTGVDCSEKSCPRNCNNKGRCVNGQCVCDAGFSGPACSVKTCPANCNERGRCVNGKCVCDSGHAGPDCSERTCPGNCNNKGRCVDGQCVCEAGFSGPDCSIKTCPANCNNRGQCVNGKCVCDSGFTGPDCSTKSCPNDCSDRGQCVDGRCVCVAGFAGPDCSTKSCPNDCSDRGQCVDGRCVCEAGFTGPGCSTKSCPNDCSDRGQCVDGRCVCEAGFTGPDCSTKSCPNECSDRGQCVDGRCVCEAGFTGLDCSTKSCPNNCNNKGRCVNGQCVCDIGFTGQDCSTKSCPNDCNNRGRCIKGRCVCRRGFALPDCSECEAGFTGPDCSTAMAGVSHLSTKDITESSVTLLWTPPFVEYDMYHITFTSKKERDQRITSTVSGRQRFYIQVGLAPDEQYTVTIVGEKDGKMGAESTAEFQTLISGPKDLQVVKRSTTSVIVQWEQAVGDIDRYVLFISPNKTDGSGKGSQEIKLPPQSDSAQIEGLEAGRLYDISLVAEKDGARSVPATVQATPGPEPPSNLAFSEVTENSLTVSWTRPKSPVSGFKVTYIHKQDGEPVSVAVDSADSSVALSKLSPGSSYEVSVISVLGLDESDSISDMVLTLPDPPTDLRAINVTDTKALLLWRPALATVDQYVIVYGSEEVPASESTVRVSGNAAEQQLQTLRASTKYTVTIYSRLGDHRSSGSSTIFTTSSGTGGRGEGPRDLTASQVTPRTAVLSWKPPASAVTSYKLTYFTEGREIKEVTLDPHITEYNLTGLHPSSTYTAQLQGQRGGLHTAAISTTFSTGRLRFPFPTDCSQQLMNGLRVSGVMEIFPGGKEGKPVRVFCDMETDGGGWTVFQRRNDGKTDFFRGWQEYSKGFGALEGDFWLGNELLHNLTTVTPMTLRVDLRSGDESVYALYSTFSVDTMKKHYMVRVSGYSGTAGDSLKYHDRRPFSTRDRDPQPYITRCAMSYRGGWWYRNCHEANLNGLYNTHTNHQGVIWTAWKGKDFSIPFAEMKLRPASFNPRTQG